jgi:isoprenylcysteine carboxyl methyltransferase (ICMT) family protein YpbQ
LWQDQFSGENKNDIILTPLYVLLQLANTLLQNKKSAGSVILSYGAEHRPLLNIRLTFFYIECLIPTQASDNTS